MKRNKLFVAGVLGIALIIFGGLVLFNGGSPKQNQDTTAAIDPGRFIKPHSPIKGDPNAKVTIVEFLDPECEACRAMHPIVNRLLSEYEGRVRLVIRYMPLHGNSRLAAAALEEAREQGKFSEALDILFERQSQWADHALPRPELIATFLKEIGVDEKSLDNSNLLSKHGWKVDLDQADGVQLGVRLTPTFFVNGKPLSEIGYAPVKNAIEAALREL